MNAAQFRFALEQLFGEGWRKKAREWLDVSESTLDRWASGQIEPIGPAIAAVQAQLHLKRRLDVDKAANRRRKFGKVSPKQLARAGVPKDLVEDGRLKVSHGVMVVQHHEGFAGLQRTLCPAGAGALGNGIRLQILRELAEAVGQHDRRRTGELGNEAADEGFSLVAGDGFTVTQGGGVAEDGGTTLARQRSQLVGVCDLRCLGDHLRELFDTNPGESCVSGPNSLLSRVAIASRQARTAFYDVPGLSILHGEKFMIQSIER